MDAAVDDRRHQQHLIDPEICIRCNTCEETCPVDAITHDARNYVVDAAICNGCIACISPCPTGAIDNWRVVPARTDATARGAASAGTCCRRSAATSCRRRGVAAAPPARECRRRARRRRAGDASDSAPRRHDPPWSARASVHQPVHAPQKPVDRRRSPATIRVTDGGTSKRHRTTSCSISARTPFPVLEGQSIGIVPPGVDAQGRPHHRAPVLGRRARATASGRGYNNVSLTVKRVHGGPRGPPGARRRSNYLCDLAEGRQGAGRSGRSARRFLMPNHPGSNLLMICTGTGSAPMRAMTERRRRRGADKPKAAS